jgi:hypothetical protein
MLHKLNAQVHAVYILQFRYAKGEHRIQCLHEVDETTYTEAVHCFPIIRLAVLCLPIRVGRRHIQQYSAFEFLGQTVGLVALLRGSVLY